MKVVMKTWLKSSETGFSLTLHVQPGAKKTEVAGEYGEALKIRLAAPPVDGKANSALLAWLAQCFAVAKRDVTLLAGEKNRHKIVAVARVLDEAEVLRCLGLIEPV
jgi:uncharacterized protein (TIGR00251 family)